MANFNYFPSNDDGPKPEKFHDGFDSLELRKKGKKKSKKLGSLVTASEKSGKETSPSKEAVAEKSRSLLDQLLRSDKTVEAPTDKRERSEVEAEKTEAETREKTIPGEAGTLLAENTEHMAAFRTELEPVEAYGGEVIIAHEKPVVTSSEAAEELQKTVETTKHAEDVVEQAQNNDSEGVFTEPLEAATTETNFEREAVGAEAANEATGIIASEGDTEDVPLSVSGVTVASAVPSGSGGRRASGGGGGSPTAAGGTSRGGAAAGGGGGRGSSGRRPTGGSPPPPPPRGGQGFQGVPLNGQTMAQNVLPYRYNANQANANVLAQRAANAVGEDAAYRRGRRRGLVAGLLLGGGVEHIRHHRREKRMNKQFTQAQREQAKTHEKALEDIKWDRIREASAEKTRAEAATKFNRMESNVLHATPLAEQANLRVSTHARVESSAKAEVLVHHSGSQEAARQATAETTKQAKEQARLSRAEQIEQERQREQLELMPGHRVERSAWHNIEVDEHGHAVNDGSLEYGYEYFRERAHEAGPKIKQQVDEAAGEVALVAAALSESDVPERSGTEQAATQRHEGQESRHPSSQSKRGREAAKAGFAGSTHASTGSSVPLSGSNSSRSLDILKTLASPPTTTTGTVGWFAVLVVLVGIFMAILL